MTDDATRQMDTPEPGGVSGAGPGELSSAPESTTSPAATTPVLSPAPGAGPSRARWAIGIGVAGLAVAGVIAAVVVFGSRPTPPALTYIPADAVMVVEARPDLPGDQMQKLGNLLAHFPGFADQATLPDKLDEMFTQLFSQASGGGVDYETDLKPWLSGPAFVALLPPSDVTAENPMSAPRGVASLTTTGTVSCETPFSGGPVTHETYRGLDLVIGAGGGAACAIDGPQALLGDPGSVRKAIDAHADGAGIDRDAEYQAARASLQGDRLATMYLSGAGYLDMLRELAGMTPGASEAMACFPATFPSWAAQGLRAEDDTVVFDSVTAPLPAPPAGATAGASLLPMPAAHASTVLPFAPANTIALFEMQGTGVVFQNAIAQLRSCPMYASALEMLNQAGDPSELIGWIEDVGVIVTSGEGGVSGGLVVVAKDAAAASERTGALKGLLSLAGMGGQGVTTTDSTVAGVTVTTVTITDLGSLSGGQVPPGVLPGDGTLEFSIATKDRAILIGSGDAASFMTAALSVQSGAGLVDQADYKAATSRALANSQMTMYLDIRDIIATVEPLIPAETRPRWDTEIKPYVAPFQALSMTASTDGSGASRARVSLMVTNP